MNNLNRLKPLSNVSGDDSQFVADTSEPWLGIDTTLDFKKGVWVEIIYSSSYFDKAVRPLLRCVLQNDYHDEILPAPVFGRAIWRGPLPVGTLSLQISPTNQLGSFCFRIDSLRVMSKLEVLGRAFLKRPKKALLGVLSRIGGYRYLARVNLRHAIGATPLAQYYVWRKERYREFEPDGLDCVHFYPSSAPSGHTRTQGEKEEKRETPIILQCRAGDGDRAWLDGFIAELQAQAYPHWHLRVEGDVFIDEFQKDARIQSGSSFCAVDSLILHVPVGAQLYPYALSVIAHAADTHLDTDIFYADTDEISAQGVYENPQFRPDFDPVFFQERDYLGAFLCVRSRALTGSVQGFRARLANSTLPYKAVHHIARVLMSLRVIAQPAPTRSQSKSVYAHQRVSIIIPTKNQLNVFKRCVTSIQKFSDMSMLEVIIVDNGSSEPDALAYLKNLEVHGFKVLYRPEPFNFSKLCNDGARVASSDFLVFLNNDTEITHDGWLEKLCYFAAQPDIGAVGAKLLYADRRVQHGGVILGLDGRAGHFERLIGENEAGYFGRLNSTHEIAAVTGACLMVEASKFRAVNGFDEVNLPVDLNDIDLCLRLKDRGWKSVFVSDVIVLHHESVSRVGSWHPDKVYSLERSYFKKRWIHELRECSTFHAALTLEGFRAALG